MAATHAIKSCRLGGWQAHPRNEHFDGQRSIISITPTAEVAKDPSITSIDATGGFAIPGFNNMHMHVIDQADSSSVLARMVADGVTQRA